MFHPIDVSSFGDGTQENIKIASGKPYTDVLRIQHSNYFVITMSGTEFQTVFEYSCIMLCRARTRDQFRWKKRSIQIISLSCRLS